MFPNAAGTALPATMNIDDNKQISGEWIFGNAKIYDKTKLRVLFFVQNYSSKEVLWATMISPVMDVEEFNTDQFINIFPNPCSSQTKIDFMLDKPENVSFKLINSFGQEINNIDLGIKFAGRNDYTLYTKDMKAGLYYLIFQRGDMKSFKKIIIN
ncbi:MAG: T9SS type A sorting domain-containing protein, partial [Bacteroidales bacterium]|nr:T9SS type A sorting domain-containing protein [Bacteroidales bacterium]